jgi:hypothetical protein
MDQIGQYWTDLEKASDNVVESLFKYSLVFIELNP